MALKRLFLAKKILFSVRNVGVDEVIDLVRFFSKGRHKNVFFLFSVKRGAVSVNPKNPYQKILTFFDHF